MPPLTITRQQSREVDQRATRDYGIPSVVLMENAGRGVADTLCRLGIGGPVVLCCGRGNNAGDGFVVARHLEIRGFSVRILLWAEPSRLTGDALLNFRIVAKMGLPLEVFDARHDADQLERHLAGAAWIVDGLLGTGASGEPRPPLDAAIRQINAATAPKLAIDLPSGLDCDTGQAAHATIRAQHTCTFVAAKAGFLTAGADQYTGQVHVLDIGAPRKLVDEVLRRG